MNLKGNDFLKLLDYTPEQIDYLLRLAAQLKAEKKAGIPHRLCEGKNVALIFEKTSTRTRSSFEVAAHDLGMGSTYLDSTGSQIGKKESIADTARVLSGMFDGIEYRGFGQCIVEELAQYASVPVWNGLTDEFHPTQILADFLTIREHFGSLENIHLVYMGDARFNMGNSLMVGCAKMGLDFVACAPKAYWPSEELTNTCKELAKASGGSVTQTEAARSRRYLPSPMARLHRIALATVRDQIVVHAETGERLTQPVDVHREGVVIYEGVRVPQLHHDRLARNDRAGTPHEKREDAELVLRELDGSSVGGHGGPRHVEREPVVRHRGRRHPSHATQERLDADEKDVAAVGFGDEVVCAERHAHDLVNLAGSARHDDDGDARAAANLPTHDGPVETGEIEVEEHEVGTRLQSRVDHTFERRDDHGLMTVLLEHLRQGGAYRLVVLDDRYSRHERLPQTVLTRPIIAREAAGS